ncbi:MAG: hypothetical protein WBC44_19695 [Planctomycetaceae bacterium]
MRTRSGFTLALALIAPLFSASDAFAADVQDTARRLEQQALDYRRDRFDSGKVTLIHVSEEQDENGRFAIDTTFEYVIIFDGHSLKHGQHGKRPKGKWGPLNWRILQGEKFIWDPQRDMSVLVAPQSEYVQESVQEHHNLFLPQTLGMSVNPPSSLAEDGLGRLLNRTNRLPTAVTQDEVDGVPARRIDYSRAGFEAVWKASVWIAPDQGHGLIRAVENFTIEGVEHAVEVRSKLKQYPDGGIWYPTETVTTMVDDGKLFYRDTVTVKEAEFNRPIDPDEFTLKGLNLEVGRLIVDRSEGLPRGLDWDGEKAVGISAEAVRLAHAAIEERDAYKEPPFDWEGMFMLFGIFILVVAATLFAKYAYERRFGG